VHGVVMPRFKIECDYDCPHCGQGYTIGDSGIYIDDVEDETDTTCDECGGRFQLFCSDVQVVMETIPVGD